MSNIGTQNSPTKDWDNRQTRDLIEALLTLKTHTEAKRFLRDLLTETEIIEFGKRWQAARMLKSKIPYTKIVADTGLSSTTVARISKWLQSGTGGYQNMLSRFRIHSTVHKQASHRGEPR